MFLTCLSCNESFTFKKKQQCARQPPRNVLCGYFVCKWVKTNGWYYNNPEEVSRFVELYHMHMFINLNLVLPLLFRTTSYIFAFHHNWPKGYSKSSKWFLQVPDVGGAMWYGLLWLYFRICDRSHVWGSSHCGWPALQFIFVMKHNVN